MLNYVKYLALWLANFVAILDGYRPIKKGGADLIVVICQVATLVAELKK